MQTVPERLGTSFHETFALSNIMVAKVLSVACREAQTKDELYQKIGFSVFRAKTNLGTNQVKSMPRYGFGSGLLNAQYFPTTFGSLICEKDENISNIGALWLMHYHLARPNGPGPAFWHHLVLTYLKPGDEISPSQLAEVISQFVNDTEGKLLSPGTSRATATAFLGTYSKSDALKSLNIIQKSGSGSYAVTISEPPPTWAFAYALADYWQATWGDVRTVNVSSVMEHGGPMSLMLMSRDSTEQALQEMQRAGVCEVQLRNPPYQVVRLWKNPEQFLEKLYE